MQPTGQKPVINNVRFKLPIAISQSAISRESAACTMKALRSVECHSQVWNPINLLRNSQTGKEGTVGCVFPLTQ